MSKGTEVTKIEETAAIGMISAAELKEIIADNMGGQIEASNLDRIKVPSGGVTIWTIPTLDGEENSRILEGVLIHKKFQNAYWSTGLEESGGGTPPDCASRDSITGVGTPGGDCLTCPLNKFGSDRKGGKGKECKNMMILFLQQSGAILPVVVSVPPTSIGEIKKHLMRLTSAGVPYYGVITQLTLGKTKNDRGIEYSIVEIATKKLRDGETPQQRITLDEKTLSNIKDYRAAIIPALDAIQISDDDMGEPATE